VTFKRFLTKQGQSTYTGNQSIIHVTLKMWYDNNGTVYATNHQICLKTFKYPNRKIKIIFNNFTGVMRIRTYAEGLDPDCRIADQNLNPVPLIMF
jgi:hypothetical protein